jgi:hypothetical protein
MMNHCIEFSPVMNATDCTTSTDGEFLVSDRNSLHILSLNEHVTRNKMDFRLTVQNRGLNLTKPEE